MLGFAAAAATGSLVEMQGNQQSSGPAVLTLSETGPFNSPVYTSRDRTGRSRQSSISSQASGDAHVYSPVSAATAGAIRQYAIPSDAESSIAGDTDDAAISGADSLQHVTKDELFHRYAHVQQRANKYKTRFSQVRRLVCFVCNGQRWHAGRQICCNNVLQFLTG